MFLAVGALMHQLLTFDASPSRRRTITALILGTLIPVSFYHCWADEIYVHELVFGVMVIITGRRIRQLIRDNVKSEESKKRLGGLATMGMGESFLFYVLFLRCGAVVEIVC
jgi:dihydroceramidase